MSSKGMTLFVYSLVGAGALAALTGCSSTAQLARSASPTVAFGAEASDVPSGCSPEGMPRVIATHVAPKAGLTATQDGSHVWLRFATTKAPRVIEQLDVETLETGADANAGPPEGGSGSGPVVLSLPDDRRFFAWTDGTLEQGMRVRGVTVGSDGVSVGEGIDLGYEGSAIGRPAVAITPSGRGVLAFIESNGAGFQVVATRVSCTAE
ncbi:MAG TPA: hypothetical protein VF765_26880 [Polyangiaceae bacterium]